MKGNASGNTVQSRERLSVFLYMCLDCYCNFTFHFLSLQMGLQSTAQKIYGNFIFPVVGVYAYMYRSLPRWDKAGSLKKKSIYF